MFLNVFFIYDYDFMIFMIFLSARWHRPKFGLILSDMCGTYKKMYKEIKWNLQNNVLPIYSRCFIMFFFFIGVFSLFILNIENISLLSKNISICLFDLFSMMFFNQKKIKKLFWFLCEIIFCFYHSYSCSDMAELLVLWFLVLLVESSTLAKSLEVCSGTVVFPMQFVCEIISLIFSLLGP